MSSATTSLYTVAFFLSAFALQATASPLDTRSTSCKCYPENACWPKISDWASLNKTVSGRLIASTPPAASCHHGSLYNPSSCAYVSNNWNSSYFHAASPISIDYPEFANSSCIPTTDPTLPCTLGYFPVYSVDARSNADIQAAVAFASSRNLRIVIKNTGHSFTGGSTGYGSLNVWTHNLKGLAFTESFAPTGYSGVNLGPALTMSAGDQWGEVYAAADARGKVVVGGNNPTVGTSGGYIQGGGHSPVGTRYGLASDQALEFEVILASGSVVIANSYQNTDLFYALRGGGGGTYGIVTKATIKTYATPKTSALVLNIETATQDLDGYLNAVTYIHTQLPTISDKGVQGYYNVYAGQFISVFNLYNSSSPAMTKIMAPIMAYLDKLQTAGQITYQASTTDYATFYAAWQATVNIDPVGYNGVIGSWLLPRQSLETSFNATKKLISSTLPAADVGALIGNFAAGGQVIANKNLNTGVNDGWRSAYLNLGIFETWADGASLADQQAIKHDLTYNRMPILKALSPSSGSYVNEADVNSPTWQQDYFGSKYSTLKSIKTKYDPNGFFYCTNCVGSEKWKSTDGRLCLA